MISAYNQRLTTLTKCIARLPYKLSLYMIYIQAFYSTIFFKIKLGVLVQWEWSLKLSGFANSAILHLSVFEIVHNFPLLVTVADPEL